MPNIATPPKQGQAADPFEPWTSTRYSHDAAEQLPPHMRPGAAVRMAMLLYLAQYPQGVSQSSLGLIAIGACKRGQAAPCTDDMRVICGHMAAEGLMAAETAHADGVRYYSPKARQTMRMRQLHGYTLPALIQPAEVTT